MILMYHRVAELEHDPWSLAVSPGRFEEHLEILRGDYRPLGLGRLLACLGKGRVPDSSVVVTFDDGYRDNLVAAEPLLARHSVPATVFVVSGTVGSPRGFWWDEAASLCLRDESELPEELEVTVDGLEFRWKREAPQDDGAGSAPWAMPEPPRSPGQALYKTLWEALQPLPPATQLRALDSVRAQIDSAQPPASAILTPHELNALAASEWIEIGAHTATHPPLSRLPEAEQWEEIHAGKVELERLLDRSLTTFSYPFGDFGSATVELVKKAGFAGAVRVGPEVTLASTSPYELPRLAVANWTGDEFAERLSEAFAARRRDQSLTQAPGTTSLLS